MFMKKTSIEVKPELLSQYTIKRNNHDSFTEIYKPSPVFKINEDKASKNEPIIVLDSEEKIRIRDGHFKH
jgi:hypothetical protein